MKIASRFLSLFFFTNFAVQAQELIPNQYIVRLKGGNQPKSIIQEYAINAKYTYNLAINGFAAVLTPDILKQLKLDQRVIHIEQDQVVHANEEELTTTWGLDRIDQRDLPLNGNYTYSSDGSNVTAYVIDTGIRLDHQEFNGRASFGFDAMGGDGSDCNGHGTHVSGTIGGATYGVAKNVKLKAVRVLDCGGSGTISGVIAGVDWVVKNRVLPATANLSLGLNGVSTQLDTAIQTMITAGVATSIAAGNSNADACNVSPARVPAAMTIGASTVTDARASFSNMGDCIDWFAPGENIDSAWFTGTSDVRTLSGTSMAAPHVAGVAALYLQNHPNATPAEVRDALLTQATKGVITNANSTNNHLLYSVENSQPADTTPPSVSLTSPAQNSRWMRLSNISLVASATDNTNVSQVRFYVNNAIVCTDTSAPYSCKWRMPLMAAATYSIKATAIDASGNVGTSQTVTIKRSFK